MSKSVNRYHSIVTRLTLVVTGILVAAVLLVGSLALLGQYRQLHHALGTKAATLAQFMVQVTPLSMLALNFVEMNNTVKNVVQTDDEAVYAVILNDQGIPLVHFFKDTEPSVTSEVRGLVKERKPLAAIESLKRSGRILEVTAPVVAGEKRIGSAILGFSTEEMRRSLLKQITLIVAIQFVIIGLSIALLQAVLRRILLPVQALTTAATQISSGDLNVVLTGTDRSDELGGLSRAFESMAVQLRDLIAGLERREDDLHRLTLFQRTILENVAYGIVSAAPDGVVSSFNRAAERLLGYTAAEVVGTQTPACWHDPEEIAKRALELSEELGEPIQPGFEVFAARPRRNLPEENEWTFIRKDGTRVPVLLSVTALRDESGLITGFVGLTYDLTERKRAVEEISKLAAIVASSDDAIFAKDLDGVILTWNRGAELIYGYSAGEAIGRSVSILIPPEYKDELEEIMAHLRQGEQIEHYTTERVCKDGKRISISLTVSPLRDGAGNIVGASSIARDVSAQKEAEEVLRRSEERLRQAQRIARIGSWELDLAENTLIWSDEIYRIFEIDPARFAASYEAFLELIHPDDRATVNSAYTSSLKNRTPYSIEHRLLFSDGRTKHVREQCETHYDADGRPFRSVGTVQDITELKQAEDAIRELNASLEKRVSERTIELQESQQALMNIVEDLNEKTVALEQANARLQELDHLKSMFIASMSHELRTPLNSIIGFSSILHDQWLGPVNKEQKENLAIILRSGKHLLSLINDVIDVSKIEAGKVEVIVQEFDLFDMVQEGIAFIAKDIKEKELELRVENSHLQMFTDRQRLLQCLLNLLSNAMKFTDQGSISVEVQLVQAPDTTPVENVVAISVTDTGIGIREEDLPKMFHPFVRLASPQQATVPGTGLGLYLTRKLAAEVLKGDILLASEYGKGSRFTIRIPVRIS